MVGSFSSTNKRGKARAAVHLRVTKNPRKRKERFGCGMQFSEGHSRIFLLEGGWWLSRTHIPNPLLGSARILKELISKILQKFEQASMSLS